jgi:hypothetical protein
MNQERSKLSLTNLTMDTNLVAQRYAETHANTDSFQYHHAISSSVKENIVRREISSPFHRRGHYRPDDASGATTRSA